MVATKKLYRNSKNRNKRGSNKRDNTNTRRRKSNTRRRKAKAKTRCRTPYTKKLIMTGGDSFHKALEELIKRNAKPIEYIKIALEQKQPLPEKINDIRIDNDNYQSLFRISSNDIINGEHNRLKPLTEYLKLKYGIDAPQVEDDYGIIFEKIFIPDFNIKSNDFRFTNLLTIKSLSLIGSFTDIPKGINIDKLTSLSLQSLQRDGIQSYIFDEYFISTNNTIKSLSLNNFNMIPDNIKIFANLENLEIRNVHTFEYYDINDNLKKLKNLKSLLVHGDFKEIPDGIGKLTSLTSLSLHGDFKVIPDGIGKLTSLTSLSLHGKFKEIPDGIGKLPKLENLFLQGDFIDTKIPDSIKSLEESLGEQYKVLPREMTKYEIIQAELNADNAIDKGDWEW